MAVCMSFPPAGDRVRRERYEELIDIIKVLKEKVKKERSEKKMSEKRRKKMKERREKKERSKEKKISEEVQKCYIVKRHLELGKRRRDAESETETETNQFEGSSSLTSEEVSTTSSYDSTGNDDDNNNNNETTTRKKQWSTSEELEYKYMQLQKLFPPRLLDAAATLPALNLDWLYPDTTKTKTSKEEDDTRGAEKRQRPSESIACSRWTGPRAQYLDEVHIFALPYVVPF